MKKYNDLSARQIEVLNFIKKHTAENNYHTLHLSKFRDYLKHDIHNWLCLPIQQVRYNVS